MLLLALLVLKIASYAQETKTSTLLVKFKGKVVDVNQKEIADVDVLIEGVVHRTLVTNKIGEFFVTLPAGIYKFILSKEGFENFVLEKLDIQNERDGSYRFEMRANQCSDCKEAVEKTEPEPIKQCRSILKYEARKEVRISALLVRDVKGQVENVPEQVKLGEACAGLYTKLEHRLASVTITEKDGSFSFKQVPQGNYYLVINYTGMCPRNIPIKVVGWPDTPSFQNHAIKIHFITSGVFIRGGIGKCIPAEFK